MKEFKGEMNSQPITEEALDGSERHLYLLLNATIVRLMDMANITRMEVSKELVIGTANTVSVLVTRGKTGDIPDVIEMKYHRKG